MKGLEKLEYRSSFYEPIKKNKLLFFTCEQEPSKSKEKLINCFLGYLSHIRAESATSRKSSSTRISLPLHPSVTTASSTAVKSHSWSMF